MTVVFDSGIIWDLLDDRAEKRRPILQAIIDAEGDEYVVPEICDYEVRRAYNLKFPQKIADLDRLYFSATYLPVSTSHMHTAAEIWAEGRKLGFKSSGDSTLDCDSILIAQARDFGLDTVVWTTNPGHIGRFIRVREFKTR